MEVNLSVEQKEETLRVLREMQAHPGWSKYLVLLEERWMINERDKSAHLRSDKEARAPYLQGVSDGLRFGMDFLDNMITSLKTEKPEGE